MTRLHRSLSLLLMVASLGGSGPAARATVDTHLSSDAKRDALETAAQQIRLMISQIAPPVRGEHNYLRKLMPIRYAIDRLPMAPDRGSENSIDHWRRTKVELWLRAISAVDAIAPAQAPVVYLNVAPPIMPKDGFAVAGMDPMAISDPVARQAYLDAIEANHEAANQSALVTSESKWIADLRAHVSFYYANQAEDRTELEGLEKQFASARVRERIGSLEGQRRTR